MQRNEKELEFWRKENHFRELEYPVSPEIFLKRSKKMKNKKLAKYST